ncbi:hypothetical protein HBH56_101590 [Parastagonospora nodorum]|nr:hypothetical protein HBH56_101590 [Parastagonospora nodorum]KAH4137919.1 hypothetical protein HBH45_116990 [Parastagonospora nodorum]KAH4246904.1 hypothetical protein HBI05_038080 [Parastagonospora nodorum]KAH4566859.1 hypothetical protein HBH84_138670 [Parastagonospora nodorum]KAH6373063.1 hypothetical protein HBI34_083710 [Parastagonospora nodorum]
MGVEIGLSTRRLKQVGQPTYFALLHYRLFTANASNQQTSYIKAASTGFCTHPEHTFIMAEYELATQDNIRRHMDDDPCVICGTDGHSVWTKCPIINLPPATDSPLRKFFAPDRVVGVRNQMKKYLKMPREEPKPKEVTGNSTDGHDFQAQSGATTTAPMDTTAAADEDTLLSSHLAKITTTGTDNLKKVRDITQKEAVDSELAKAAEVPSSALGNGNIFKSTARVSSAASAKFPLRKEFANTNSEVFTNHFEVVFKPTTQFFVYEVLKMPAGKSKRKSKFILKTAIEAWDFLKNNKEHFTTGGINTIVAWKDLHSEMNCNRVVDGADNTQVGAIWMPDAIADGSQRIQLFIKLQRELDLAGLQNYINASQAASDAEFAFSPIVDALNIAVSSSLSRDDVILQSASKFFVKNGYKPLAGGKNLKSLCTIRGYYYTIKPGMQKVLLNVNAATSAFFCPITVADFLKDETFTYAEREKHLKTLRLYIEPDRTATDDPDDKHTDHLNKPQNRIKSFCGLGPVFTDSQMSFHKNKKDDQGNWVQDENKTRVIDHLQKTFAKPFKKDGYAINVGTAADTVYYPAEYLRIMPYQIYRQLLPDTVVEDMLTQATHLPEQSRRLIEVEAMHLLGLDPAKSLQNLRGCPQLQISPTMLQIPSAQMEKLDIIYGAKTSNQQPNTQAQWNLQNLKAFIDAPGNKAPAKTHNCLWLVEEGIVKDTVENYQETFGRLVKQYGICAGAKAVHTQKLSSLRDGATHSAIKTRLSDGIQTFVKNNKGTNLVVLLLKTQSIPVYSAFKAAADTEAGLQSICMTQAPNYISAKQKCKENIDQYMANIMMKANLKFGGGNHTVQFAAKPLTHIATTLQDTLVLGADITHPSPGSLVGCPSIAAVVGSVNSMSTKYLGSMRLQETCKKEIIDDLQAMVYERIVAYEQATRNFPKRILFYRDGVSTGQFAKVRDEELPSIKAAFRQRYPIVKGRETTPLPRVTIVVAVKRHHTRFYPAKALKHLNGNCVPGTLVDRVVTSPHYCDFFLQSHHGLKGTAIPTHYVVIANEIGLGDKELQELTWKMCYTYVRATLGVSYAPPAYYSDRLCDRGRAYMRDFYSPDPDSAYTQAYDAMKKIIEQNAAASLAEKISALPPVPIRPGRNAARKSAAQIGIERAHRRAVEDELERQVLAWARKDFEDLREGGCGPWKKSLDDTMFWM